MRIVQLKAENFKRLQAVQIDPDGDMITIGGDNGEGKSSVLDAIWVALAGKSAAPPKPIRAGQQQCTIELDLGQLRITRTFRDKDGKITDTVKVESAEGLRHSKPQEVLDALIGAIGFDPLDFARRKPEAQAEMLLEIVPLAIDLEGFADQDQSDFARRREINREVASLESRINAMPEHGDLPDAPIDINAIMQALKGAADANTAIERDKMAREERQRTIDARKSKVVDIATEIAQFEMQISEMREEISLLEKGTKEREAELAGLDKLAEPVDTEALSQKISEAQVVNARIEENRIRAKLVDEYETLRKQSAEFTNMLAGREKVRREALASAKMPIDGLAIAINEKGKPVVEFAGVPFEQISTAEQIRASTAIAMAANPELRVLRIKDGSMLDKKSLAIIGELARSEDFQLWLEIVGEGDGVGFIMEDGLVRPIQPADETPASKPAPKSKAKDDAVAEGGLL